MIRWHFFSKRLGLNVNIVNVYVYPKPTLVSVCIEKLFIKKAKGFHDF